jgi:putative transposase
VGRERRIEQPGGIYQVISRGNYGQIVFVDRFDYSAFLELASRVARRHRWIVYAYCLMPNHYHFLMEIPFGGLSEGMRELNGRYSRRTNRRYGRTGDGHLFRNRFYADLIERDSHLLELCRYIVLNPVRARLCAWPDEWLWSSYRVSAGLDVGSDLVAVSHLLGLFGSRLDAAASAYRAFVRDGHVPVSDTDRITPR